MISTRREEPGARLARGRDAAAYAELARLAERGDVLGRMRSMPPATADHVARALGWELGATRATLQGLSACGLVAHDDELATWAACPPGTPATCPQPVDAHAAALLRAALEDPAVPLSALDVAPVTALSDLIVPSIPSLQLSLREGGRVLALAGSAPYQRWIEEEFPRARIHSEPDPRAPAYELVLHASPLEVPDRPEHWLAAMSRRLAPEGRLVFRVLETPLAPPEPREALGRGWWHALSLVDALRGGSGRACAAAHALRAADLVGLELGTYRWREDPGCVHLVGAR